MTASFDILGLGCVAIDDLLYVPAYPPTDAKVQVRRRERQCGGLTATALVTAARLGATCVYAGILGDDQLSQYVVDRLAQEGVDTRFVRRLPGAQPIYSIVIVDEARQTRTIFYDLENVLGAQEDWPDADVIRSARVLFVDHFGVEGMSRAARVAQEAGIPVVADFESDLKPGFPELLALVDHLIISQEFAEKLTGESRPEAALERLWAQRQAVIVTCGAEGCWYLSAEEPEALYRRAAYPVEVVDTTGCGDVFHGAYACMLARGLNMDERVRFASAAAALKATQRGGQTGIPTCAAVEAFLKEQGQ
jgi:sulfofructose kinase